MGHAHGKPPFDIDGASTLNGWNAISKNASKSKNKSKPKISPCALAWKSTSSPKIGKNIAHLANYPLDYAISAIHNLDGFPVDSSPKPWQALDQDAINDIWRKYYRRLKALAETKAFSIIAHFDLPKKFGFRPTIDLDSEITAALQAVRDSGAQLELNTAGWSKPCAEPYPSPSLLKRALALDIPILITADAHAPQHVNRDFDKAIELLNSLA